MYQHERSKQLQITMTSQKLTARQVKNLLPHIQTELGHSDLKRLQVLLNLMLDTTLNYATAINTLFPNEAQQTAQGNFRSFRNRINTAAKQAGVMLILEVDSQKRSAPKERECWFLGEDSKVLDIESYSSVGASDSNSQDMIPVSGKITSSSHDEEMIATYKALTRKLLKKCLTNGSVPLPIYSEDLGSKQETVNFSGIKILNHTQKQYWSSKQRDKHSSTDIIQSKLDNNVDELILQNMHIQIKDFDHNSVKNDAHKTGVCEVSDLQINLSDKPVVIATEYLMEWLKDRNSPVFCALLGDYGIGKTTTCKALTRELLEKRQMDKALPLPIYIDLREYTWDKRVDFTLTSILDHILKKSWKGGQGDISITPEDIIQQVQNNQALIIWDGLDEVTNHLDTKLANDFIRQLWRILPPLRHNKVQNPNAGKMLISCRTHYFRNLQEQNTMLTGEYRDGIKGRDYRALILIPFNAVQIEAYLSKTLKLDNNQLQSILTVIHSVYNLPEFASRPYLLSIIAQHIPHLGQMALNGEPIQSVTLYQSLVESWLSRDAGKHQFTPQHKKQLMEYLAAALWESGQVQWTADELDEWLDVFLYENPILAAAYQNSNRAVLKEDLRTATFVVRSNDHFSFAHTSLQEFFLAAYLQRALYSGTRDNWRLTVSPSPETLEFLVQLLLIGKHNQRIVSEQHLANWLAEYEALSSKLIFRIWLLLAQRGETISYQTIQLPGENFFRWEIKGTKQQPINLHDVNFYRARLEQVTFDYVNFHRCNFSEARLWQNEFQHCCFTACQMEQADLMASMWRLNELHSLAIDHSKLEKTTTWARNSGQQVWANSQHIPTRVQAWISSGRGDRVRTIAFSLDRQKLAYGHDDNTVKLWSMTNGMHLKTLIGHHSSVLSVAFSPDNVILASGSADSTVKLWDIIRGKCLKTLAFHHEGTLHEGILSVKFSPDGLMLASSASDNTVRLWHVASGRCLKTLVQEDYIREVAFSPDNLTLATGSADYTVGLWDIASGVCLKKISQDDSICAVAFSPNGRTLATGSADYTVRLWDIASGQCLHTLMQHKSIILSVVFSRDGWVLASGSLDTTIKLWDVVSGDCLKTLAQHQPVLSIAFSFDDLTLMSGSNDSTLKRWDVTTGHCLKTWILDERAIVAVAFSADGLTLVSGSNDNILKRWDVASGNCLKTWVQHHDGFPAAADNAVKLQDIASGECLKNLEQHQDSIQSMALSPDGRTLALGFVGNAIQLWDIVSGKCIRSSYHLPHDTAASIDEQTGRIIYGSAEAWRWLRYKEVNSETGEITLHPAEIFGALPGSDTSPTP